MRRKIAEAMDKDQSKSESEAEEEGKPEPKDSWETVINDIKSHKTTTRVRQRNRSSLTFAIT